MTGLAEFCETLSETMSIRTPGMFVTFLPKSEAFGERPELRRNAHRKSDVSGSIFSKDFHNPHELFYWGYIEEK